MLNHVGHNRLVDTINMNLFHPDVRRISTLVINACDCQKDKQSRGYGQLPPRNVNMIPFESVCVDVIGPRTVNI